MSRILFICFGMAVLFSSGSASGNGAGWPPYSRIGASPKNTAVPAHAQYELAVQLRDNQGNPVPGFPASQVELDFDDCNNPTTRPQAIINPIGPSDENGWVHWPPELLNWGGADPCPVEVRVLAAVYDVFYSVRSPDVTGDGIIGLADLIEWQSAFIAGGPAYIGDLVPWFFDDRIALNDLLIWQIHFAAP